MNKYLALSLILIVFIFGVGIGYVYNPESKMETLSMQGLGLANRTLDLRYINAMATHHQGAILLAEQVKTQSQRPEIKALAEEILASEPKLISRLYDWKTAWYKDNRKAQSPVAVNLGSFDENLDLRFLNALIAHHEEGVLMAKEAMAKSSRNEILTDASAVAEFLSGSGQMLKTWRQDWYGIK